MEKKKRYWKKAKIDWSYIAGFFDGGRSRETRAKLNELFA